MAPANTRATKNHKEVVEKDSLYILQQHMTPSTFIPQGNNALRATLPSASAPLVGQPRPSPIVTAPTEDPYQQPLPGNDPIIMSYPTHSHIASSGRAPPPREISPEVIHTPTFIAALDELLDRREPRVAARATRPADLYHTEEATSRTHVVHLYASPPQVIPPPKSTSTQGIGTTMAPPVGIMTREEIEEFVAWTVKEQNRIVMSRLRDRVSHPFTPEILAVTVSSHVQNPRIDSYKGEGDPVEHIENEHRHASVKHA